MENSIISERQAAYLKGDSTMSQLLYIVHFIRSNWGKKNIVQGAFLDISAAFDKVWHQGLLAKLNQIGINGKLFDLFTSYLINRKHYVKVQSYHSKYID